MVSGTDPLHNYVCGTLLAYFLLDLHTLPFLR